jgi:hypothetical protein
MTAASILTELRTRGVELIPEGTGLRCRAPRGTLTPELRQTIADHKPELLAALTAAERIKPTQRSFDLDAGELAAVKLVNTVIGDCWLVADDDALAEHPDIIRAGLPVFFFDEVEQLRGKTTAELKAIGLLKTTFPTSRVLQ